MCVEEKLDGRLSENHIKGTQSFFKEKQGIKAMDQYVHQRALRILALTIRITTLILLYCGRGVGGEQWLLWICWADFIPTLAT